MSWKIRHEGSPRAIEGLTLGQVIEGLRDNLWEVTDEVMGPNDKTWTAIENHPQLAEIALDIEPPPPPYHDDETRLDMTALIDVTLVLLIFFVLILSYASLQKALEAGEANQKKAVAVKMTRDVADKTMIMVKARPGPGGLDGDPVIMVGDEQVNIKDLPAIFSRLVKDTHKTELLIDAAGVKEKTVMAIEDAAAGTGIKKKRYQKVAAPSGQ